MFPPSCSLYFHIGETEKKCFIEEIPDETMVIGKYRTQLWDKQANSFLPATPGLGMHVEIKDPETKYREERFRMTSESTNQRVLWWSIAQTLILLVTGIWQMKHLKSFFEAKKLV
ncbi:hypothetical protein NHX12_013462 [Muraenolepis orangiensis]|uniref:GOLD domain-containing protein n=1 Tax=Muraenolepis orangiensis TaxID=630683 RepID=A0A9Q0DI67_9TELE|nr:hypothetical protein NHX12_013462 [Muraenolepis orangiensis]